jgi:hypothetical protein
MASFCREEVRIGIALTKVAFNGRAHGSLYGPSYCISKLNP